MPKVFEAERASNIHQKNDKRHRGQEHGKSVFILSKYEQVNEGVSIGTYVMIVKYDLSRFMRMSYMISQTRWRRSCSFEPIDAQEN